MRWPSKGENVGPCTECVVDDPMPNASMLVARDARTAPAATTRLTAVAEHDGTYDDSAREPASVERASTHRFALTATRHPCDSCDWSGSGW